MANDWLAATIFDKFDQDSRGQFILQQSLPFDRARPFRRFGIDYADRHAGNCCALPT